MIIKTIYSVLLLLLNFSISFGYQVIAGNNAKGKPFINYYSPKVYKSNARNWDITQDPHGIMYFANETGVLEYDGNNWRKIRVPQDKPVRSISIDDRGKLYVCADIDFGYLEPDKKGELQYASLLPFLKEKYHNFGEVSDVKTIDNFAYFKTKDKIFRWDGLSFTVWDSVFAFQLHSINDKIYVRNESIGLMVLEDDELKLIPDGDFFSSTSVSSMLPYGASNAVNDSLLIASYEGGLFLYDYNKFSPFKTEADKYLISNQINNAEVTSNGNFALTTQRGGVVIIDKFGKLVKIIDEKSGLQTNVCYNVFRDKSGGLWLTSEYGINYIKEPSPLSSFKNSGDLKNISNSVYRFKNKIYAATELGPMILKNNDVGFQLLNGSNQPSSVFAEFNDQLFVGTSYGTYLIENNSITKEIINEVTTCILVSDIFPGRIYIGTYNGFSVLEKRGSRLKVVYKKELPDEVINIIEEGDGSLWINGFFPGLISVTGSLNKLSTGSDSSVNYKHFDNSDELPGSVSRIIKNNISPLFITNNGIYTYNKLKQTFEKYSPLSKALSDPPKEAALIANGKNNSIWILAYLKNKPVMGKALMQPDGNYTWQPIPELSLLDLNTVYSIYPDSDPLADSEKLWLSTEDGLVLYDPSIESNSLSNYSTLLRKVTVKQDSIIYYGANNFETDGKVEIEYSKNDIMFEYSAAHYDKPNSTYFKTYLEGEEDGWSGWGLETKKVFTNLSQGDYVFRVTAKNLYGIESNLTSYSFTVLAPWYLTWWAFILYALFTGGTLFSIRKFELDRRDKNNRVRESELKAETAEFQAKAAETQAKLIQADNDRKTKELEEARELQLSMLPKELPDTPDLDIAVYMQTATEVGGDYYDFSIKDDGSLNIALGDATGHGMKAGILVTMMKSLFNANSIDKSVEDFFTSSNRAIKNSKLGRMMMAFAMMNIKNKTVTMANAGIPPVYIYRKQIDKVEEVKNNGLPLGAMKISKYEIFSSKLQTGDIILMLSDGFPELQNENNELYGYGRMIDTFKKSLSDNPEEIIKHLKTAGANWIGDNAPIDDVTFVVIKIK
ncbi:MAG: SpoIIE family protein phosphatase [Ignavibacteriae bacterium]|nr:hypothetical protein [Ignavibacteriota bacterium]NOG99177.1 SpoIIE family protein phosphatase [Ignavibacteriota bacterium]